MGNCKGSRCCKDISEILNSQENVSIKIISQNNIKKGAYNDKILSLKYHEILNKIRENPSQYITDSKSYNLSEIFIKLKPSNPIKFSNENVNNIISYLEEVEESNISIYQKERKIASMINQGNIKKICIFETNTISDNLNVNLWNFLSQNEDDIEQIISTNYEYIIILCLPLIKENYRLLFIFYNQTYQSMDYFLSSNAKTNSIE